MVDASEFPDEFENHMHLMLVAYCNGCEEIFDEFEACWDLSLTGEPAADVYARRAAAKMRVEGWRFEDDAHGLPCPACARAHAQSS